MEFSEESEDECPRINIFKPKKRPTLGRIRDVSNKLKVKGYVTGEDCNERRTERRRRNTDAYFDKI